MLITFCQSHLAGCLDDELIIDTSKMESVEAKKVEELVRNSQFFQLPAPSLKEALGLEDTMTQLNQWAAESDDEDEDPDYEPDELIEYEITVQDGGRKRTFSCEGSRVPEKLDKLVNYLVGRL